MMAMKAELQQICADLFGATLNGVYQGVLVCVLVGFALRLLVRTNAATRYAVWFATLVLVVLALPLHYWLDSRRDPEQPGAGRWRGGAKADSAIQVFADSTPQFGALPP